MRHARNELVGLGLALVLSMLAATSRAADSCDAFCHLAEANKASLIMLHDRGLLDRAVAGRIAAGISAHAQDQSVAGSRRSSNYLHFEQALEVLIGEDASRLHVGRSRQDLHETVRRLQQRDLYFAVYAAQLAARHALLNTAQEYANAVIPAYTHGVQAQPTSAGQYFLAFASAMERDSTRLRALYARLNRSPLGAAALGTSGFALDRAQLSDLLGFLGPVDNAYDATLVASVDSKIEMGQVLATAAIPVAQLIQNLHTQYHDPMPWMQLGDGQTSGSSIMPQKRNPRPLDRVRSQANAVIGGAQLMILNAHNTNTGMHDYRGLAALQTTTNAAIAMYERYADVIATLHIDRERALAELNADYSTMTEVADVLVREAGLPFRTAHHFASTLTTLGRSSARSPMAFNDQELAEVYQDAVGSELPLPAARIRSAMDPTDMVAARKGQGGPQAMEVDRMLGLQRERLAADRDWLQSQLDDVRNATAARRAAFDELLEKE